HFTQNDTSLWPFLARGRKIETRLATTAALHRICSSSICNFGCGAGSAIAAAVFGSLFSTSGRAGILRSRGWSGWSWRSERLALSDLGALGSASPRDIPQVSNLISEQVE